MKRAGVRVGTGTRFAYDGEVVTVVELHLVDGVLDLADRSGGHGTKALRADCIGGGVGSHTVSPSVLGTPVKVDPLFVCGVWPGSRAVASLRGTAVGVEVERPQCSEDERPRGRRGSAVNLASRDEGMMLWFKSSAAPRDLAGVRVGRAGAQPYLGPRTSVRRHDDRWGARRVG